MVVVRSGSRITNCGPQRGDWKLCFRFVESSVPPAKSEYSPAEREVGMEIMGIDGGLTVVRLLGPSDRVERSVVVWTSLARACYYH